MAKFRNVSDDTLSLPRYGVSVEPGGTLDIDDAEADSLTANPSFERIGGSASRDVLSDATPAIPSADQPGGVTTSFHGN